MKKVYLENDETDIISLKKIGISVPIFIKLDGKLVGMIVYRNTWGWINYLKVGSIGKNNTAYFKSRAECIAVGQELGLEYFVES